MSLSKIRWYATHSRKPKHVRRPDDTHREVKLALATGRFDQARDLTHRKAA